MDSLTSVSRRMVTSFEWGTSVESLIKALQNVQNFVLDDQFGSAVPNYAIPVDVAPHTDEANVAGRLRVIEEKLTDGSFAYSVELF
jgi:hypothetical protein